MSFEKKTIDQLEEDGCSDLNWGKVKECLDSYNAELDERQKKINLLEKRVRELEATQSDNVTMCDHCNLWFDMSLAGEECHLCPKCAAELESEAQDDQP